MNDLDRLRDEYEHRTASADDRYSWLNPVYVFQMQSREQEIISFQRDHFHQGLGPAKLLEIGCGSGGVIFDFVKWGLRPENCVGIDLLFDRLGQARHKLAGCLFSNANGERLPFAPNSFDLALQFTAFSSILDDRIKGAMAAEMLRVLKPNGFILWYDFWWNPTNAQTRGIRPPEIRELFPGCDFTFRKITLAPPIARRIVPFSWPLGLVLESLKIFNSHYLVLIEKLKGPS